MSDKIELIRLCTVLQRHFSCVSQSDSQTQPCCVRIMHINSRRMTYANINFI